MLNQVRLRYIKFKEDRLVSQPVLCNTKVIVVTLNTKTFQYYIVDKETSGVIYENKTESLHKSKKYIKQYLKSMGANFYDEVRLGGKKTGSNGLPSCK